MLASASGARLIAEDRLRRIARQHAREHEDDREHGEQRRDREEQALENVAEHGALPACRPSRPAGREGLHVDHCVKCVPSSMTGPRLSDPFSGKPKSSEARRAQICGCS